MNRPASFNFAEHQRRARRQTMLLVAAFLAITLVIAAAIGVLAGVMLAAGDQAGATQQQTTAPGPESMSPASLLQAMDYEVAVIAGLLVLGVILLAAGIRSLMLGSDGANVAKSLGGKEVTRDSTNPSHRRYFNVVEEIAIAANQPMPRVFVIKHEQGINAFAAGLRPETAAIGMTHGALASLDRDELTGVVAHEFAHISNGDMRLNLRLMAMIFGLVALYVAGRMAMRATLLRGNRDQRAAMAGMAIGLALIVLGGLGMFAGRLLQAGVSRRREYLADATGAQFTRNPEALARALKKIGALQRGERLGNPHGEEVRHMLFADGLSLNAAGLTATHPPLVRRIQALDPAFDPETDPVWSMSQRDMMKQARAGLPR